LQALKQKLQKINIDATAIIPLNNGTRNATRGIQKASHITPA
jgi:hypothetical protein